MSAGPVSVIVLTWNGLEVTRRCLTSLLEVTDHPDFEVVVVDNNSTDGTLEYLRGVQGIRLIENIENLGFVRGNNAGIRSTRGDVVLMNNDTEVIHPGWLSRMQELAYSRDDVGIVGCRLVNGEGRLVHAGTYMPTPSFWGQEYPGDELDMNQYTRDREVDGVIAACVYIKRSVIDEIGPLDEDYFSYYEDTDYCLKARRRGFRVLCCGSATVRHLENASTDLNRMDFSGTFRRSREVFMSKWGDYYDSLYTRKLTWRSFISGGGFYPRLSSKILWALDRARVHLNLGFLEGAERAELDDFLINDMKNREPDRDRPQVVFGPPEALGAADGSYNIGYVFTPYDRFPQNWVKEMNRLDEIWVPSDFQMEAARLSGVRVPVTVIPFGVDPDYFHPGIRSYPLQDRFLFLAPGEWGPGSDFGTLLRAFTEEFEAGEGVVLAVVTSSGGTGAEIEEAVEAMNLPLDRAPVVFVVDHDIPGYQQGCLYASSDCVVFVDTCSGGSTGVLEAVACGVPVITTGWGSAGGPTDSAPVFGVGYRLVETGEGGLKRAEPDLGDLRRQLRAVHGRAEGARRSAVEASERLRSEYSWDTVVQKMVERLDSVS